MGGVRFLEAFIFISIKLLLIIVTEARSSFHKHTELKIALRETGSHIEFTVDASLMFTLEQSLT